MGANVSTVLIHTPVINQFSSNEVCWVYNPDTPKYTQFMIA